MNVFTFIYADDNIRGLQKQLEKDDVLGAAWQKDERGLRESFEKFLSNHAAPYTALDEMYIISNIHAFAEQADFEFERVERSRLSQQL